jgi:penicillin-binding protein 1C
VKTGTSQAYHDNWTVGYTRDVTVGVWVGNFDRTPLRGSSGVTGAGPIFHAVMLAAQGHAATPGDEPVLPVPSDLRQVTICALSGEPANPWCPSKTSEWVVAQADAPPCSWHHRSDEGLLTIYPPEYRRWSASAPAAVRPPSSAHAAAVVPAPLRRPAAALSIANPPDGAVYSVDPTLRREFQALPLRAVTPRPTTVRWSVDGAPVGTASSEKPLDWPLAVGTHRIEAMDPDGRRASTSVVVR